MLSLLYFWLDLVLSKNKNKTKGLENLCTAKRKKAKKSLTTANTDLPVTLLKVLDKFHQVCWVSDDFKVEFFY